MVLFSRLSRKHDDRAWSGVVIAKHRRMLDGSNLYHHLEIRTADGTTTKERVDGRFWKAVTEGDQISKVPGEPPVKVRE